MVDFHDRRDDDYHGLHRPSDDGPPIRDLLEEGSFAPSDIYTHTHYYADPSERADQESMSAIHRARGRKLMVVYRAAPKGANTINTGDWVTPSRTYARGHAKHSTDPTKDMPVYKALVPTEHVRWPADSINEFGYFGPPTKGIVHNRGGKNAERLNPTQFKGKST